MSACQQLLLFAAASEVVVSPALRFSQSKTQSFQLILFFPPYVLHPKGETVHQAASKTLDVGVSRFAVLHLLQLSPQKFGLAAPAIPELAQ